MHTEYSKCKSTRISFELAEIYKHYRLDMLMLTSTRQITCLLHRKMTMWGIILLANKCDSIYTALSRFIDRKRLWARLACLRTCRRHMVSLLPTTRLFPVLLYLREYCQRRHFSLMATYHCRCNKLHYRSQISNNNNFRPFIQCSTLTTSDGHSQLSAVSVA